MNAISIEDQKFLRMDADEVCSQLRRQGRSTQIASKGERGSTNGGEGGQEHNAAGAGKVERGEGQGHEMSLYPSISREKFHGTDQAWRR